MSTDIGHYIRRERQKRGWTLDDLAERSGLSRTALSELETGKVARPRLSTLDKIGKALHMDPRVLETSAAEEEESWDTLVRGVQAFEPAVKKGTITAGQAMAFVMESTLDVTRKHEESTRKDITA